MCISLLTVPLTVDYHSGKLNNFRAGLCTKSQSFTHFPTHTPEQFTGYQELLFRSILLNLADKPLDIRLQIRIGLHPAFYPLTGVHSRTVV